METSQILVRRLNTGEAPLARQLFAVMADAFEQPAGELGDPYLEELLTRPHFWVFAAFVDGRIVGGLTAHTLPMTRSETSEAFIYDLAVHQDVRRRGIGRLLIATLREEVKKQGIHYVFVPVEGEDEEALEFYRAVGGQSSPVNFVAFE